MSHLEKIAFALFCGYGDLVAKFAEWHPGVDVGPRDGSIRGGLIELTLLPREHDCHEDDPARIGTYELSMAGIHGTRIEALRRSLFDGDGNRTGEEITYRHVPDFVPWHAVQELRRGDAVQRWQTLPRPDEPAFGPWTRYEVVDREIGPGTFAREQHALAKRTAEERRVARLRFAPGDRVRFTRSFWRRVGMGGRAPDDTFTVVECDCGLCRSGRHVAVDQICDGVQRHVAPANIELDRRYQPNRSTRLTREFVEAEQAQIGVDRVRGVVRPPARKVGTP